MEDKALMQILVDMLEYYKHQSRTLIWVVVIILAMHVATIIGFLYYESQYETEVTTKTTTQTVDGDEGNIVNGDQFNDNAQEVNDGGNTDDN